VDPITTFYILFDFLFFDTQFLEKKLPKGKLKNCRHKSDGLNNMDLRSVLTRDILLVMFEVCNLCTFVQFRFLGSSFNQIVMYILKKRGSSIANAKDMNTNDYLFMTVFYSKYGFYNLYKMVKRIDNLINRNENTRNRESRLKINKCLYTLLINMPQFWLEHIKFYRVSVDKIFEYFVEDEAPFTVEVINNIIKLTCHSSEHKQVFIDILDKYLVSNKKVNYKQFISHMNRWRGRVLAITPKGRLQRSRTQ
jgi:hypothetical protein